jgi:predicted Zn-dependent peptidase
VTDTATEIEQRLSTLPNGVRVITERVPGVRSVALGFFMPTGSVDERPEQAGISHLLEHMIFRGTERHRSVEIDQIFDAMGAEINAGTDREATSLFTRVLDHHLERALQVMGQMVWRPAFEDLEAEREVVLEEIAMYEDDPQDRVYDVLGEAVFGDHPLGRPVIGTAEVVGAITSEQLAEFHADRYAPHGVVVAAAGSVDHDTLLRLIGEASEQASSNGARASRAPQGPPVFKPRARFLRKDTEQYHVCLGGAGIARSDERRFALRILDNILGGTSSSRLFQEVRERRGLAYSVFSFSNMYANAGEIGLYVGTRPENLRQALEVLAGELERFVSSPVTEEELTRSRENVKGRMVLGLESTGARMSRLGSSVLHGMPILSVEEVIERIDAVQQSGVTELAGELYESGNLSVAGVGAEETLFGAALQPLGELSGLLAANDTQAAAG